MTSPGRGDGTTTAPRHRSAAAGAPSQRARWAHGFSVARAQRRGIGARQQFWKNVTKNSKALSSRGEGGRQAADAQADASPSVPPPPPPCNSTTAALRERRDATFNPGGEGGQAGGGIPSPPPGPASAIVSAAAHARLNGERRHRSPFVQNERLKELRKNVATNVRSGGRPWQGEPQGGRGRVNSDQKNAPIYSKHRTRSRDFKGGPAGASCVCLLAAVAAWCCCCCLQIAEPLHDAGTALLKTPLRWGFYFFTF